MTKLENDIFNCLEKIINNLGYELYDVIYEKQGKENHLCIFIDKQNGINIEDCEIVNNAINDVLDEKNFIKDQYYLEVSSTGLEKRIRSDKHLENAINTKVFSFPTFFSNSNISKFLSSILTKAFKFF